MTHKRTLLLNREDCWVRSTSSNYDMDWNRESESSREHYERLAPNQENQRARGESPGVKKIGKTYFF